MVFQFKHSQKIPAEMGSECLNRTTRLIQVAQPVLVLLGPLSLLVYRTLSEESFVNSRLRSFWERLVIFGLGIFALLAGQIVGLGALVWWSRQPPAELLHLASNGVAVTIMILVSAPIELLLLVIFAERSGQSAAPYLGWVWPRRRHVVFGVIGTFAFYAVVRLIGQDIADQFPARITETARAAGWLPGFAVAVVVLAPMSEETLFRGFLFRGWLKSSRDAWPVIIVTAFIFAILHVQYNSLIMVQIFVLGILFGWMRWVSGSSILTALMHGLFNLLGLWEVVQLGFSDPGTGF